MNEHGSRPDPDDHETIAAGVLAQALADADRAVASNDRWENLSRLARALQTDARVARAPVDWVLMFCNILLEQFGDLVPLDEESRHGLCVHQALHAVRDAMLLEVDRTHGGLSVDPRRK